MVCIQLEAGDDRCPSRWWVMFLGTLSWICATNISTNYTDSEVICRWHNTERCRGWKRRDIIQEETWRSLRCGSTRILRSSARASPRYFYLGWGNTRATGRRRHLDQPCREGLGSSHWWKVGHETKMCAGSPKSQIVSWAAGQAKSRKVRKGILPLCSTQVTPAWSTASSSGIPTKGRYGLLGMSPEEVLEDGLSTSAAKKFWQNWCFQ